MMSLEGIMAKARSVSDAANSKCQPDLAAAVIDLADLIVCLAHHVSNVETSAQKASEQVRVCLLANGIQPDC